MGDIVDLAGLFVKWYRLFHSLVAALSYPAGLPHCCLNFTDPTVENAYKFVGQLFAIWLPGACVGHYFIYRADLGWVAWGLVQFLFLYSWHLPHFMFGYASGALLPKLFRRPQSTNRLFGAGPPAFKGPRVVVLGNGPSLVKGAPLGKTIDAMDEVVRFNNFQTKASGLQDWCGYKTTVHFSDSMLYPSYPEYHCPGACTVLSLFMDRLMVAGSYFIFRMGIDLRFDEAWTMMSDPALGWISHEDITSLKKTLGISKWKHPTSGCLAIDWFVRNRPDPSVPVYIHGFDFFQGPEIHYYSKTEPLMERLNDLVGVKMMHEPHKEKAFVERLVKEGKVKWLTDAADSLPSDTSGEAAMDGAGAAGPRADFPIFSEVWRKIVAANRVLTVLTYPIALPCICTNHWPATPENARLFWRILLSVWIPATLAFQYSMSTVGWGFWARAAVRFLWFWAVDVAIFWASVSFYLAGKVLSRPRCTNRLFSEEQPPAFKGPNIVVLGNGPSLAKGDPHGGLIDGMDEVIRFNNCQTKRSGLESWTGTKTTVHFSDSMLQPSYPEYRSDGACKVLSLFMDRLMVSASHFCFRLGIDLAVWEGYSFMFDPALGWVPHEDIHNLKKALKIDLWKHPTSGCLAIDWFVRNRPDKSVPVYIHGFDFFEEGVHYYGKTEPLYERINDLLGVFVMHQPQKEKAFVEQLVKEGKVRWLRDLAKEKGGQ